MVFIRLRRFTEIKLHWKYQLMKIVWLLVFALCHIHDVDTVQQQEVYLIIIIQLNYFSTWQHSLRTNSNVITGLRLILSAADDPKIAAYLKKQTKDDQILLIDCSGGQYKIVPLLQLFDIQAPKFKTKTKNNHT